MAKLPWMKWYPNDWLSDAGLRSCSPAARGIWADLLCVMHSSGRRGYLTQTNGRAFTLDQLARMTGCSTEEFSHLRQELLTSGVCSATEDGTLFSRRMVRDSETSQKRSEAGTKGGFAKANSWQNSGKQGGKHPGPALTSVLGVSLEREEIPSPAEKEHLDTNFPRDGGVGEGVLPQQNSGKTPGKTDSSEELTPATLAVEWIFHRKGDKGVLERDRARGHFEEMIRQGVPAKAILAEIVRRDRRKTEPVWEMEKRLLRSAAARKPTEDETARVLREMQDREKGKL